MMLFLDRSNAGRRLSEKLLEYKSRKGDVIVLGLARGGVPVAAEIATALDVPLDVLLVRKIGAPFQSELALGALCEDEEPFWNESLLGQLKLSPEDLDSTVGAEREKIRKQNESFRGGRKIPSLVNKTVIMVDDGLATGATAAAAAQYLKKRKAGKIIVAVPVAAASSARHLRTKVDDLVAISERDDFGSVGQWYGDFTQVSDAEVIELLQAQNSAQKGQGADLEAVISKNMTPIRTEKDLDPLIDAIKNRRIVMLGESTHGTHEFYELRRIISQRLIADHGFKFIAVEGDWPDAWRINKYIHHGKGGKARDVLIQNHRWPTWMWANEEVVKLAEWMRTRDASFYGLDVYSLFESIEEVITYVRENNPEIAPEVESRYSCFEPFEGNEISYVRSLMKYPPGCEEAVLKNLQRLLNLRVRGATQVEDELFNSQQNAYVIAHAETYYRSMLAADVSSWNIRDRHMLETLDRLLERAGDGAKAIVWAHNTHVGDYRATDMEANGYVNLGGLARLSYGETNVALVGFSTHKGQVIAGSAWGAPEKRMRLPPAHEGSYEYHFHQVAERHGLKRIHLPLRGNTDPVLAEIRGQRAVGVVYDPQHERRGNYVPTSLSKRYDAFVFVDETQALQPLHTVHVQGEFPETWPSGQ